MQSRWLIPFLLIAVAIHSSHESIRADDVPLVAVFRTNGEPVQCMAFSADGSKLATSLSSWTIDSRQKVKTIPGEAIVWDVATTTKVCAVKGEKADFTHLWLSADGSVLVTSDHGVGPVDGLVKVPLKTGSRGQAGYRAWDATTGKPIGKNFAPPRPGEFTTAALSPDGRWLATVYNAMVTGEKSSPLKPFQVGQIEVWDLRDHKVAWKVPGVSHQGRVTWTDSLAFAPDGNRLVHFRSGPGGPSSEAMNVTPDRRGAPTTRLNVLQLEAGQESPTITTIDAPLAPVGGIVEWLSGGKVFVLRNGRSFEVIHSDTNAVQPPDSLPIPMKQQPPISDAAELPRDWFEPQAGLSADGSRFAAHFVRHREETRVRENFVTIWDSRARTVLGSLQFPDESLDPKRADRPVGYNSLMGFTAQRIALSGDGHRLAVSDRTGVVRVYDVSEISGLIKLSNDATEPPPGGDTESARRDYEQSLEKARELLLSNLDMLIERLGKKTKADARTTFERLKGERERFEKTGLVPWSEPTWDAVGRYIDALAQAHERLLSRMSADEMPDDLRMAMTTQIVATWNHHPKHRPEPAAVPLFANGKLGQYDSENTWSFSKGKLTFHWKNAQAPGGYWIDSCAVSSDGLSYSGENQNKTVIDGTLITEAP